MFFQNTCKNLSSSKSHIKHNYKIQSNNLYEIHLKKIHGCFLSGRYMFLAENSIVEDPSASANSAIWCKFDDSSRATNLPQHLTDREALPRELPCGPPASHAIGIFLSSWSFSLAPLQKPTQSCQRLLSKS